MKIKELKLHPFAGTRNRTVNFTPGLNVILGANEAGKSTLIKGLSCLFFTAPDLTPAKFKSELSAFLPLSGGDTIRISADIDLQGENYHLEKEFGAVKRAQLVLPTNAELNNITEVQKQLLSKLGFSKATYEQVLITHQSDLANTINTLKNGDGDTKTTLSDNLRRKSYELDGISVQKLKAEIDREVKEFFNNWDENTNLPRDRKDFDNPHKSNIGNILKAYYTYRKLEKQLADAERYEKDIDLVNAELQADNRIYEELLAYKTQFAPLEKDARKRHELETTLTMLKHEIVLLEETSEKWPVEQTKLNDAISKLPHFISSSQELKTKIDLLKKYDEESKLLKEYQSIIRLYEEYKIAEEKFKKLPVVTNDILKEARKIKGLLENKENELAAKELIVTFKAKKEVKFGFKKGLDSLEEIALDAGERVDYDAKGGVRIEHGDLIVSIVSGRTDVKQLINEIEQRKSQWTSFLLSWNIKNIEELDELKIQFETNKYQIEHKLNELKKLTQGRKISEIKELMAGIVKPDISEPRDWLELKYNEKQVELGKTHADVKNSGDKIKEWEGKYISKENFNTIWFNTKAKLEAVNKQIGELKPLPENFIDTNAFLSEYSSKLENLEGKRDDVDILKERKNGLESKRPENSTEDLQYDLELVKKEFDNTLQKGKAYKRIQTELDSILKDLDKDTFTPLKERTEYYFHKLTGGKYNTVKMQETIPSEIELNGTWLPENLLSTGTLDLLALATRLAMADFYLEDKSGFIVLDDPLVNLDPARQEMAAKCLREIAQEKQVIVLTCHPSHAAMLQGDLIEL